MTRPFLHGVELIEVGSVSAAPAPPSPPPPLPTCVHVNPCSLEMAWPTGTWRPDGENRWIYLVTDRVDHGFQAPGNCNNPVTLGDQSVTVFTEPGEVPWYEMPEFTLGPCENVRQYEAASVFVTQFDHICIATGIVQGFIPTSGLRSFTITATVEPSEEGTGPVEPFPSRQEFADRYFPPINSPCTPVGQ